MRAAIIADVHIGNHKHAGGRLEAGLNDRARICLDALSRAIDVAIEHECDAFVILGDLLHSDNASPQLERAVQDVLTRAEGMLKIILLGNHERKSAQLDDHALGPLEYVSDCCIHAVPGHQFAGTACLAMVPYRSGPAEEWLESAIEDALCDGKQRLLSPPDVLCLHLGLRDKKLREHRWAREAEDAVDVELLSELCHKHKITRVYAGNWHTANEWTFDFDDGFSCVLTQVGALVPTGWNNPGLEDYGGVYIDDLTEEGRFALEDRIEVPGPRFVDVASLDEVKRLARAAKARELQLHVRMSAAASTEAPDAVAVARAELGRYAKKRKDVIMSWDVVPDAKAASKAAQCAVAAARSSVTLRGAVDAYFDRAVLPGVSGDAVQARVYSYLGLS